MKFFITSITILCLTQLPELNALIRVKSFTNDDPLSGYRFQDKRLVNVTCSEENTIRCKIEQLELPSGNTTYSCEVELPEKLGYRRGKATLTLKTLGKDKLIIAEAVPAIIRFYTVHLAECRLSTVYQLSDMYDDPYPLTDQQKIAAYENTYDVFYGNDSCSNSNFCKIRIDSEGRLIDGPIDFDEIPSWASIHSITDHQLVEKGLVYWIPVRSHSGWLGTLRVATPDGTKKQLMQVLYRRPQIFTNDGLVGAWFWNDGNNFTLLQTDALGNIKSLVNLTESNREEIVYLPYIYNLSEGGFLLFKMTLTHYRDQLIHNHIVKLNAAGKIIGEINFDMPDYINEIKQELPAHVWKNEETNEYCAALIGTSIENNKHSKKLVAKCFSDTDFL